MVTRFGRDNVDDFIAGEMANIEGGGADSTKPTMRPSQGTGQKSVSTSKPNFGFSSAGKKSGGAFAKPTFMSKPGGAAGPPKITLKKKRGADDDFI